MIIQPTHVLCVKIQQDDAGLALPYRSFFITETKTLKVKATTIGGDFEIVLPYTPRNVSLFSTIETEPTFIVVSFLLNTMWDTEAYTEASHPMPMVVETYYEQQDFIDEEDRTITISGRGVLNVALSNKVIMPKTIYQYMYDDDTQGFYPWDIAVDLFGRNVNGEKTGDELPNVSTNPPNEPYLLPPDPRFVSDISLLSDITPIETDPKLEREYDGEELESTINTLISSNNLYVSGKMSVDQNGRLHFDYTIRRLTDLRLGTAAPLVYDFGAMPPKVYNKLISTQELRQVLYVRMPETAENRIETVTRGSAEDNQRYKGWFCKEAYLDASSLPIGEPGTEQYLKMLTLAASDELYKEDNMLVKVENVEYYFTPMDYYVNCWPGCIYTSIGPDGLLASLVITAFVLTGSTQDGWVITPELSHYIEPYQAPEEE